MEMVEILTFDEAFMPTVEQIQTSNRTVALH